MVKRGVSGNIKVEGQNGNKDKIEENQEEGREKGIRGGGKKK